MTTYDLHTHAIVTPQRVAEAEHQNGAGLSAARMRGSAAATAGRGALELGTQVRLRTPIA